MRFTLIAFFVILILDLLIWLYLHRAINRRAESLRLRKILIIANITISAIAICALISFPIIGLSGDSDKSFLVVMWMLWVSLLFTIPQCVIILFDLIGAIPLIFKKRRLEPVTIAGAFIAIAVVGCIIWGTFINRYSIQVKEVDVEIEGLPESFDGYTIAQISDLHVGSYGGDTTFVARIVERINSLQPDIVIFTGDLVNRHASEAEPFMPALSQLSGRDGQYAILGNHDYADYYYPRDSINLKRADLLRLKSMYASSPIMLLDDRHHIIHRGNDSIALIGVENIGMGRFPNYGSLEKAYPSVSDNVVKILLSHDPAHWSHSIADQPQQNIALTLSGHTHAMQTVLLGWTPAIWHTPTPSGLYTDSFGRHLYVNIGIGTVGTPMRIGATPEITLLRLQAK